MSRRRRVLHWSDDSDDDDEFPDLANLAPKKEAISKKPAVETGTQTEKESTSAATTAVRRRKLGKIPDNNSLLRAWSPEDVEEKEVKTSSQRKTKEMVTGSQRLKKEGPPRKDRVELRTRKSKPAPASSPSPKDDDGEEEFLSAQEEVEISIIEDVSLIDDSFHSCESDDTELGDVGGDSDSDEDEDEEEAEDDGDEDDSDEDFQEDAEDTPPRRPSTQSRMQVKETKASETRKLPSLSGKISIPDLKPKTLRENTKKSKQPLEKDITDKISKLRLDAMEFFDSDHDDFEATPPSTPPKSKPSQRSLASPTKIPRIPSAPHHASSDVFWSQEFVDDWNDQHSPVKTLFPSNSTDSTTTSKPSKSSTTTKTPQTKPAPSSSSSSTQTASKKAFSNSKQTLAQSFLIELDNTITSGQLAALSSSTGGIHLIWTNKLSTTAGRANWKRSRTTTSSFSSSSSATTTYQHHASIELSTKIISDPHRLLNVIAHEFCHLANFMVSGITTNPHGREFKAWASKVTSKFGQSHGIEVTTKHSYEIDFKYVWSCEECATEFKRHSRSIDVARHRCGVCKGVLRQVKPTPRGGGGGNTSKGGEGGGKGGGGGGGLSEYQVFMKEEMKRVKEGNPKMKQNEVMKIVAGRWKEMKERKAMEKGDAKKDDGVKEVRKAMEVVDLT
ncbi:SprT-like family-domain-containing protein [Cladorrhinum sp. PSN332]|nr:SprT-like family-domain-containing protein [Cladorrhinum sp. PSN332]